MMQCEEGTGLRLARLFSIWYGNPCSREFMVSGRILNTRAGAPCSLLQRATAKRHSACGVPGVIPACGSRGKS